HWRLELVELLAREPVDVMMLGCRQRERAGFRPREIDHSDVLMDLIDSMDVEKPWRDEGARTRFGGRRPLADHLHVEPALLACLAQGRLLRLLIQFHMTSQREPFIE